MFQNIKAVVIVLSLTLPIWILAGRLISDAGRLETFKLRRNTWVLITIFAFLSPNIWVYALFAAPLMVWAGARDPNPAALFLLLMFAVPPAEVAIPSILVNQLFGVSHHRLLCFSMLVAAAVRISSNKNGKLGQGLDRMDVTLLGFLALGIILFIPYESFTNTIRRTFLMLVDTWIVYYVMSRINRDVESIRDCMTSWMMAGILMAPIAVFETVRQWLLYTQIATNWGAPNVFSWLMRGDSLRAQAAFGHSLTLGAWLAISWGFFLYIKRGWSDRWTRYSAAFLLLAGLGATISRAPWLMAVMITIVFLLLDPRGAGQVAKGIAFFSVVLILVLVSPWASSIIDLLPFVGTVDSGNVEYRQRLFTVSMSLIERSPFFGDPFVIGYMESLRQGQGIIDLVNGYIQIALFTGLVGLAMFLTFLGLAVMRVWVSWRRVRQGDAEAAFVGGSLMAAMVGTIFFIATASHSITTFILAGLCASYWRVLASSEVPTRHARPTETARPLQAKLRQR